MFFRQQEALFGWFEYLNNITIDEQTAKKELEKLRNRLRQRIQLEPQDQSLGPQELNMQARQLESRITSSVFDLSSRLRDAAKSAIQESHDISSYILRGEHTRDNSKTQASAKSQTGKTVESSLKEPGQLRSLFKFNSQLAEYPSTLGRIHSRKEIQQEESYSRTSGQLFRGVKNLLSRTERVLAFCQAYHEVKARQHKFSPTKLKGLEIKLSLVDKLVPSQTGQGKYSSNIYFGHHNWNLALSIMVGLRKSIKSLYDLSCQLQIREEHFSEQHQFLLGNKTINGRQTEVFKFIEIAPVVFERLRHRFGVSNEHYQRSVGPESLLSYLFTGNLTAFSEKCSTGKSKAFFYLSLDSQVFLKTLTKEEFIFFVGLIKNYYEHMHSEPHSLIVRIYGLYKLKVFVNKQKIRTVYFIAMENIFASVDKYPALKLQRVYDLKGSLYNRSGSEGRELKDNDWVDNGEKIKLPPAAKAQFLEQIHSDSRFFKKNNINDYSLMVAVLSCGDNSRSGSVSSTANVFKSQKGGIYSREAGTMYILSIIDILTAFEARKNFEYLFKTTFLSKDVSCIPPQQYCKRFRSFIAGSVD